MARMNQYTQGSAARIK